MKLRPTSHNNDIRVNQPGSLSNNKLQLEIPDVTTKAQNICRLEYFVEVLYVGRREPIIYAPME
jgi:hypothetical protein